MLQRFVNSKNLRMTFAHEISKTHFQYKMLHAVRELTCKIRKCLAMLSVRGNPKFEICNHT